MESQSTSSISSAHSVDNDVSMSVELAREEFADFLRDEEKNRLDEVDVEGFVVAKEYLDSLQTDEGVVRALVEHWVQFLRLNEDYESYCIARSQKDKSAIAILEKKYPTGEYVGIKKLYADWDDIHADGWEFEKWFASRRHLFLLASPKIEYVEREKSVPDVGEVWVSLPRGIRDKQVLNTAFAQFYNKYYLSDHAAYCPEYRINGRASASLVQKLEMATMVDDLLRYHDGEKDKKADREYSHAQVVKTIMFNPLLRYSYGVGKEWKEGAEALSNHAKNGDIPLTSPEIRGKKPYIIDLEKFFKECVKTSVLGIFPAQ